VIEICYSVVGYFAVYNS